MTIPSYLNQGDTILIIATARKILREELSKAISIFESWGLKVELAPQLFEIENQFAGSDEIRAQQLQWAINHPTAKAIICSRGGYGTMRILDKVDFKPLQKNPKWIIGYSDITALHGHLFQQEKLASIHGEMCLTMNEATEEAIQSLKNVLFGEGVSYSFPTHQLNRNGKAEGEVIGGNLSLLYALKGTSHFPDMKGKILFIEDLDEYLYHIDRMMLGLKMSGAFSQLSGVIIGGMSDMRDNPIPFGKSAEEIIQEHLAEYNFPIAFNFPAGHIKNNCALMIGVKGNLEVGNESTSFEQN